MSEEIIVDESILSTREWRLFKSMSLHKYKEHRRQRGLEALTQWQEQQLVLQRIYTAVVDDGTKGKESGE
jgi:hypothetical protein